MTAPRIAILVPYRPSGDRHRWLWDMVRPELERFGWPISIGTCEGRWARAAAVNDAARNAGNWDVAFIADCDTLPDHDGILRAITWVQDTGGGARPHDERYMLNQAGSLVAVQRGVKYLDPQKHFAKMWAGGGLDVVTRDAWETVGGMNETYKGWGYEDSDFHVQLVVKSRWDRLPGDAWHLHHDTVDNKPDQASVLMYRELQRTYKAELAAWTANKGLRKPLAVF